MEPVTAIVGLANTIFSRVFGNKDKELELKGQQFLQEFQERLAELDLAKKQIDVNAAEANNPNRKWITWRELIGYCCAFSVMWTYCLQPFITYIVVLVTGTAPNMPVLDMSQLMMLLFTMLGMGGYSMIEKVKGIKK